MPQMVKTTIYLPTALKNRLERLAEREQRSEADLIREALETLVDRRPPQRRLGLFASGDPTLAERVDDVLAGGFGDD